MNFHRRQFQFFGDIGVLDSLRFVQRFTFHPLGDQGAGSDSGTAAIGLEARVFNDTFIVDFNLQLHDVAARRRANHTATDAVVAVVEGADVARVFVMIDDFFAVCHDEFSLSVPN